VVKLLVLADIILLVVWEVVSPRTATLLPDVLDEKVQWSGCASENGMGFETIVLLYKACSLLYGTVLCYQVRNAPSSFSEIKFVGAVLYNSVFTIVIVLAIYFMLDAMPQGQYVIGYIGVHWIALSFPVILFWPKIIVASGKEVCGINPAAKGTEATHGSSPTAGNASMDPGVFREYLEHCATCNEAPDDLVASANKVLGKSTTGSARSAIVPS
jgi:hypothetical protein